MSAVPAPANFQILREQLESAQIDVNHLCFQLEQFLQQPEHLPRADWSTDPLDEHQAWEYRKTIQDFVDMIQTREDDGDGEE